MRYLIKPGAKVQLLKSPKNTSIDWLVDESDLSYEDTYTVIKSDMVKFPFVQTDADSVFDIFHNNELTVL